MDTRNKSAHDDSATDLGPLPNLDGHRLLVGAGALEDITAEIARIGHITLDQRMTARLASTFAIHQSLQVVDTAYHAAGSTAIFEANPFERRFRDIHTVSQQLQGRQEHFETVGQYLLGLDPGSLMWL